MVSKLPSKDPKYEGDNCYRYGDLKNALCWYKRGLKKNPENIELLTKKANTLVSLYRYTSAFEVYDKAFFYAHIFDLIDNYVEQYQMDLNKDVNNLLVLLNSKYNIPITLEGLILVLKKTLNKRNEYKEIKEWQQFKKNLQNKKLLYLEDYVNFYLKKFGEKFYIHFRRFYCYLKGEKEFSISSEYLAEVFLKQRKKIEIEQFERILKTGGGKKPLLDKMSGIEFEHYLTTMFESKGYFVKETPLSHDYGADLIVERFGERTVVQAKRTITTVGLKAIQEIFSAKNWYNAHKAIVITSGKFTKPAVEMANRQGVELWDRKRLLNEINNPWF